VAVCLHGQLGLGVEALVPRSGEQNGGNVPAACSCALNFRMFGWPSQSRRSEAPLRDARVTGTWDPAGKPTGGAADRRVLEWGWP